MNNLVYSAYTEYRGIRFPIKILLTEGGMYSMSKKWICIMIITIGLVGTTVQAQEKNGKFLNVSVQSEIQMFLPRSSALLSPGNPVTIELGSKIGQWSSISGLVSFLDLPYNSTQIELVDATIYGAKASYWKYGIMARTALLRSTKLRPYMIPHIVVGGGLLRGKSFEDGASMAGDYSYTNNIRDEYLFLGFGLEILRQKRISYFIDYRMEQYVSEIGVKLIETRSPSYWSFGFELDI